MLSDTVPKNSTKLIKRDEKFPDHNVYQLLNSYYVPGTGTTLGASHTKPHLILTKLFEAELSFPFFLMRKWEAQKLSKLFHVTWLFGGHARTQIRSLYTP